MGWGVGGERGGGGGREEGSIGIDKIHMGSGWGGGGGI